MGEKVVVWVPRLGAGLEAHGDHTGAKLKTAVVYGRKNYAENHYYGFDDETFKNTNLKYAQMSAYMESFGGNPCGWLDTYVKYPVLTENW